MEQVENLPVVSIKNLTYLLFLVLPINTDLSVFINNVTQKRKDTMKQQTASNMLSDRFSPILGGIAPEMAEFWASKGTYSGICFSLKDLLLLS